MLNTWLFLCHVNVDIQPSYSSPSEHRAKLLIEVYRPTPLKKGVWGAGETSIRPPALLSSMTYFAGLLRHLTFGIAVEKERKKEEEKEDW